MSGVGVGEQILRPFSSPPLSPTPTPTQPQPLLQFHRPASAAEEPSPKTPGNSKKPQDHLATEQSRFRRHRHPLFRAEAPTLRPFFWSQEEQLGGQNCDGLPVTVPAAAPPDARRAGGLLTFSAALLKTQAKC